MGNENTIKQRHLHTPATVNRTEAWLKQKAKDGWKLIDTNGWNFVFRKCTPSDRGYLMYSSFRTEKGLWDGYYMTNKLYGKAPGKSEINKKTKGIFEADIAKLDKGYFQFVKMRNSYYLKTYIGITALLIFFLFIILLAVLFEKDYNKWQLLYLLLLELPMLIYYTISTIILVKDVNKLKNQLADNPYNR